MFSSIGDTIYSRFRTARPLQVFLFESEVWATQPLWECDARVVVHPRANVVYHFVFVYVDRWPGQRPGLLVFITVAYAIISWQCILICNRNTVTVHRTRWWWSTPESVVAKVKNVLQLVYLFITSLHYIVTYIVVHLKDNFPWYFTWFTWCFCFSSFSWNIIFGYILAGLRKLFQKTTKDRDVIFSPVVATWKFCHIRWFVMMWLHIEPLQPISSKKDVLC